MKELFDWNYHQSSENIVKYRDFQKFNKMCIQNKVKGKKQVKDYYEKADYVIEKQKANGEVNF